MGEQGDTAVSEMLKSIQYLIDESMRKYATKCYSGLITQKISDNTWKVNYNGESHELSPYGNITPTVGKTVRVIVPQGNQSLAFFF